MIRAFESLAQFQEKITQSGPLSGHPGNATVALVRHVKLALRVDADAADFYAIEVFGVLSEVGVHWIVMLPEVVPLGHEKIPFAGVSVQP